LTKESRDTGVAAVCSEPTPMSRIITPSEESECRDFAVRRV
jgi:hypothetical protein